MHRRLTGALTAFALAAALAGGALVSMPEPAQAQLYAAGMLQDGICTCPVDYGDCVCKLIK